MHNKKITKAVSFALMLAMLCTAMPLTASAKMSETGKTIQKFENLEERFSLMNSSEMVYSLEVTPNTSLEDLKLPDVLAVTVEKPNDKDQKEETAAPEDTLSGNQAMTENKTDADADTDADANTDSDTVTATENVSVSWTSDREYLPDAGGTYLFSAQLPEGYMLDEGILLPKISVSVSAGRQMRMAAPASLTGRTTQLDFKIDSYKTEDGVVENPTGVYSKDSEGWSYDANSNTLTLNGLNLVTTDTLALKGSGDFKIVLADNSINTITSNSQVTDSNTISAGIDAKKLTILGNTGVLSVRGGNAYDSYGILCESFHMEGGVLKTHGGTVGDSNSDSVGLMFSQDSTVRGGSLTAVGGTCGDDQASMGIEGIFGTNSDLTVTGGRVNAYTANENTQWVGFDIAISVPGVLRIEGGTVDAKAGTALYSSIGILSDSVLVTGGTLTAKYGVRSHGLGSLSAVEAMTTIEIGNNMGIYTGPDFQTPAYVSTYTSGDPAQTRFIISTKADGTESASPIQITAKKSFSSSSSTGSSSSSQTPTAPAEPVMASVNYNGATLKSWKDIQKAMANLSAGNLKDMPEQKGSVGPLLLQVDIQNTTGYLPSGPVSEIAGKQNVGLHLFLGNGVAVTLFGQNVDANFKGTNLSNIIKKADTQGKKEYLIDFKEKGKIGAVILLHASIPDGANNKAAIYKEEKDGSRTLLLNSEIHENGSICFPIDTKEKFIIEY